ncbi:hypothetical protein Q3G72_020255 [Acer saccharum]|nr:hypothetical protein Q3G72_020255 [Acer saccharum]
MALAQAQPAGSSTNCTSTCGNVPIPFPFGIEWGCSMDTTLKVDCNHSTPYLHDINLELLNISTDGTVRINFPVYNMSNITTIPSSNLLKSTSFILSPLRNNLVGIGNCSNFFLMASDDLDIARCSTTCNQNNDYCQDQVKSPLKEFSPYMESSVPENGPYYSALVERQWLQDNNPQDIKHLTHVPVVLEWSIPALTFNLFESTKSNKTYELTSTCERNGCSCFSIDYPTVQCKCLLGFQGNPYLLEGCQDIDECAENATICGPEKYCENYEGGYNCYASPTAKNKLKLQMIIIGLSTSFGSLFLIIGAWLLYKMIKRRNKIKLKEKHFKQNGGLLLKQQLTTFDGSVDTSKLINSKELDKATDHFNIDRILGQGGQGTVYKGMLADGRIVAVKKSKVVDKAKLQEFINEVVILSQINHRNVVKLLGCCLETEVPLLVYEFIQNGTLFHYLHEQNEDLPFTWDMRLRIAIEIAGALSYLHSSASIPIYHRDIKTSNILLDDKYRAKVADFGTSRSIPVDDTHLTTKVQGTFGYFDPEYFRSNQFTDKSDVYSFGVVLVELLTGQKPIFSTVTEEGRSLASYFINSMEENKVYDILDAQVKLGKEEEIMVMANLAFRCLNLQGKQRPTMREVAMVLEGIRATEKNYNVQPGAGSLVYWDHELFEAWDGSTSTGSTFNSTNTPSIDTQALLF